MRGQYLKGVDIILMLETHLYDFRWNSPVATKLSMGTL